MFALVAYRISSKDGKAHWFVGTARLLVQGMCPLEHGMWTASFRVTHPIPRVREMK